jgi:hypothetical protein
MRSCRPVVAVVFLICWWTGVGESRAHAANDPWSHCGVDWLVAPDIHRNRQTLLDELGVDPVSSFVIILVIPDTQPEWVLRLGLTAEGYWTLSHAAIGSPPGVAGSNLGAGANSEPRARPKCAVPRGQYGKSRNPLRFGGRFAGKCYDCRFRGITGSGCEVLEWKCT